MRKVLKESALDYIAQRFNSNIRVSNLIFQREADTYIFYYELPEGTRVKVSIVADFLKTSNKLYVAYVEDGQKNLTIYFNTADELEKELKSI